MANHYRRSLALTALALCALLLPACMSGSYAFDTGYRTDIQTVTVPIFGNGTQDTGIELELTEAIVKEIHRTTPWKVLSDPSAQTTLTGSVVSSTLRKLSTDGDSGLVRELAVDVAVTFEWKDTRSGEVLVARRNFRNAEPFAPALGASERIEVGRRAVVNELARSIVAELRTSW